MRSARKPQILAVLLQLKRKEAQTTERQRGWLTSGEPNEFQFVFILFLAVHSHGARTYLIM